MAKKNIKGKSRGKPERRSGGSGLFHFITLPPVRRLILVAIILAVIFWQWSTLTLWATEAGEKTLQQFGWGLFLIAIAIATLVVVLWQRKLSSLVHHWYRWLGGVALIFAIWGILAFCPGTGALRQVTLGGDFGLKIIGYPDVGGCLRILGLVIIGIILIAPRVCFHLIINSIL